MRADKRRGIGLDEFIIRAVCFGSGLVTAVIVLFYLWT